VVEDSALTAEGQYTSEQPPQQPSQLLWAEEDDTEDNKEDIEDDQGTLQKEEPYSFAEEISIIEASAKQSPKPSSTDQDDDDQENKQPLADESLDIWPLSLAALSIIDEPPSQLLLEQENTEQDSQHLKAESSGDEAPLSLAQLSIIDQSQTGGESLSYSEMLPPIAAQKSTEKVVAPASDIEVSSSQFIPQKSTDAVVVSDLDAEISSYQDRRKQLFAHRRVSPDAFNSLIVPDIHKDDDQITDPNVDATQKLHDWRQLFVHHRRTADESDDADN